jgi:chemotaxis protein MotA
MEGVTEILAGTNPRALRVRLQAMLPPSEVTRTAA